MKKFFVSALKALAVTAIVACASVGAKAAIPDTQLRTTEGETVQTGTLATANEQPVILTFFATWCKPCMRELHALSEKYDDLEAQGIRVVAVSIDEATDEDKVITLANSKGWPFEVLLDPTGELRRGLGVQTVPHAFVLDTTGEVVLNHPGYQEGSETELIEAAEKAVKK